MRDSQWCLNHDPGRKEINRRRSSKGGKRGGRGRPSTELSNLRAENGELREKLLDGEIIPAVAAVAVQSINTDIRAVQASLKAREQEEVEERLEALEAALDARKQARGYGA